MCAGHRLGAGVQRWPAQLRRAGGVRVCAPSAAGKPTPSAAPRLTAQPVQGLSEEQSAKLQVLMLPMYLDLSLLSHILLHLARRQASALPVSWLPDAGGATAPRSCLPAWTLPSRRFCMDPSVCRRELQPLAGLARTQSCVRAHMCLPSAWLSGPVLGPCGHLQGPVCTAAALAGQRAVWPAVPPPQPAALAPERSRPPRGLARPSRQAAAALRLGLAAPGLPLSLSAVQLGAAQRPWLAAPVAGRSAPSSAPS